MDNYTFYGQYKLDQALFETIFKHNPQKDTGIAIEAGAVDGIRISNTKFFEDTFNWKTINIEANPEQFEKLKANRPNAINIHAALSDVSGETLHIKYIQRKYMQGRITTDQNYPEVVSVTYPDIIKQNNIPHVTLFSLDVEGYELKVLDGMLQCTVLPDVICVEDHQVGRRTVLNLLKNQYAKVQYRLPENGKYINSFYIRKDKIKEYGH